MLFTKAQAYHSFNLNPFELYLNNGQQIIELILNTAYFIPLGCLYGLRAKPMEAALIALVTIIGIETIQYVFYIGTFDIWDIFTNFAGCMLGYFISTLIKKRMNNLVRI